MGATFPIATAAAAAVSADAARLYAANTAGAAVGAVAAGFWLLPALGLRGTTWVGVSLNVAAAAGAMTIRRTLRPRTPGSRRHRRKKPEKQTRVVKTKPRPATPASPKSAGLAALAVAVSGFSALVYEVAWTRLIALVIGPTTYAFATMAASVITGLAAGRGPRYAHRPADFSGGPLARTLPRSRGMFRRLITAWYTATVMPLSTAARVTDPSVDFSTIIWQQAVAVGFVMLPMTLALGAAFPLALDMGSVGRVLARETATVYAANTVGAITGALSAGFLLIPALGLRDTIRFAAMTGILGSAAVFLLSRRAARGAMFVGRATLTGIALSAAAALIVLAVPAWDRALLASGAYKYAPYLAGTDLEIVLRAGRLQYDKEGAAGTVSVRDLTGTRSLAIDGKVDASNSGDMLTQRLLALLPILIHGHAEDVAIIGLGSGVTAGTALAVGTVRRVDIMEISPEVVEASRFFERENGNVLARPKARLIVGDGRSHLQQTSRQYDVLVSEPSNPWMAGVASLFTREFFEAARNRLKPDGVICQWAHTYDIHPEDLRSIVRTFGSVFPQGSMWLVGGGDLLLIGTPVTGPRCAIRSGHLRRSCGVRSGGSQSTSGRPEQIRDLPCLSLFAGGPADLERFAKTDAIQIDDRTALEFSAPRGIYGRSRDDNATAIRALRADLPPVIREALDRADDRAWAARGTMDLRAQAFASAYDAFRRAVERNSRNIVALAGLSDAAGAANRLDEERQWLTETAAREPSNAAARIELSRVLAVSGDAHGRGQGGIRSTGNRADGRPGRRAAGLGLRGYRRPGPSSPDCLNN